MHQILVENNLFGNVNSASSYNQLKNYEIKKYYYLIFFNIYVYIDEIRISSYLYLLKKTIYLPNVFVNEHNVIQYFYYTLLTYPE